MECECSWEASFFSDMHLRPGPASPARPLQRGADASGPQCARRVIEHYKNVLGQEKGLHARMRRPAWPHRTIWPGEVTSCEEHEERVNVLALSSHRGETNKCSPWRPQTCAPRPYIALDVSSRGRDSLRPNGRGVKRSFGQPGTSELYPRRNQGCIPHGARAAYFCTTQVPVLLCAVVWGHPWSACDAVK